MKRIRNDEGFTLIELLIVVAIIGIIAAIAVPGLLRARQSGNEASAIGSVRAIASAQATFAASCGGGGYALSLAALAQQPPGGVPFISPDLANADVAPGKSGYFVDVNVGGATPPAAAVQVLAAANTCNTVGNSMTDFLGTAVPITVGTTGQRSFATDARGTIYQDTAGIDAAAFPDPLAVAGTTTMLQ